jgi:hypothetical protein
MFQTATEHKMPFVKLVNNKRKNASKSKNKKGKNARGANLAKSASRRDCKACVDLQLMNIKAPPMKFTHDFEKLKYFVKLY